MSHNSNSTGFFSFLLGLFKRKPEPSYEELLEKKKRLKKTVLYWQYPSGRFVPPHKRHRLMADLRALDRIIHEHPGNPALQAEDQGVLEELKVSSDSGSD
ncbi:hypothetical protein [Methylomagnum sp.]